MTQDSFPNRGPDGEEPDGSRPLPAGRDEPDSADQAPGDDDQASADDDQAVADDGGSAEQGLFVCLPAEELTLSGFAQNGRADTMAPGPLLATLLESITGEGGSGLAGLADDQLVGIISAARRMESRAAWTLMAGLAELARRRPADGPCDSGEAGFSDFAADEVAAELHLTNQSATDQIWYAREVAGKLPRCFAALAAGRMHPVHLRIIQDEVALLSPEDMAQADEQLAGMAGSLTFGRLRSKAHRLVLKLDPDAARKRKEAAKQDAHVRRFMENSGNAGLIAQELPPDEILASWQHLEQRALDLRAAGMPGTLRELRVQAFLDLLQERDSRLAPASPHQDGRATGPDSDAGPGGPHDQTGHPAGPGGDGPAGPRGSSPGGTGPGGSGPQPDGGDGPADPGGAGSGGSGPQPGGPGGTGGPGSGPSRGGPGGAGPDGHARQTRQTGPSVAALVNITVPLAAWLDQPGTLAEVAGFGLLDAEDARDLVAAAARHPHTRWCVTALHPDGTAAAHGCAVGRHPPPETSADGGHAPSPGPDPPGTAAGGHSQGSGRHLPGTADGGHSPRSGPDPPHGTASPTATDDHCAGAGPDPPPGTPSPTATAGAPGPDPLLGTRLLDYLASLRIRMIPVARGHCDHTRAETGYRPSRALQHLVKVRNTRCTAPGCGQPAARCDLDHTLAWDQGGLTCECDLAPLCRHHHRCKQSQGWKLEQPSPGVLRWWTPAGRSYSTTPTTYAA